MEDANNFAQAWDQDLVIAPALAWATLSPWRTYLLVYLCREGHLRLWYWEGH